MNLFGRKKIYTDNVDSSNILSVVNKALEKHSINFTEEQYLYNYRRGKQPILDRVKNVRSDICNKVVENHADEIVNFKNGYFLAQPAYYKTRKGREESTLQVEKLNDYLYMSGKHDADNEVVNDFHTMGIGVLIVEPDDETIVTVNALDPRYNFVTYHSDTKQTPALGIHMYVHEYGGNKRIRADVYTYDKIYIMEGADVIGDAPYFEVDTILETKPNFIGMIPMVEYRYASTNMGAFESVIPLLDAINVAMSNRIDGIEQFIQALLVLYNCDIDEGTTATDIKAAGLVKLRSVGDMKADIKEISAELNQTETQVLVDHMYDKVLTICGMPTTQKGGSSTSDTGAAVIFRDGWYQADSVARNTEDLFRKSNRYFDKVFLRILSAKENFEINPTDFELLFPRTETQNLQSKAQAALSLKQLGLSPELVLAKSGVSVNAPEDVESSKPYIDIAFPKNEVNEAINDK